MNKEKTSIIRIIKKVHPFELYFPGKDGFPEKAQKEKIYIL